MNYILKGDIAYSVSKDHIKTINDGYLLCLDNKCKGVYKDIPDIYKDIEVIDYTGKLIIPGMVDLHVHAPQYKYRCLGMDLELMDWLHTYTFKEEAKYKDLEYARSAYSKFVLDLKNSATTRASIFATIHVDATKLLMDMLEETGLVTYVGKINMDHDAPDDLIEDTMLSAYSTFGWLNAIKDKYERTFPILTPRFLLSCSKPLLEELEQVELAYNLPIQSHLSENPIEVELVKKLFPETKFYGEGYDNYGMFGTNCKTIMAHSVYSTNDEIDLMQRNGVFIAHCPSSNMNLSSGIAPIRKYLDLNMKVGLGSDVAGGESLSIFKHIGYAIQVSKLYWRYIDSNYKPLQFDEAFYLATLGGGEFFGKVGTFLDDYEFDALVIDDSNERDDLNIYDRLQRAVYSLLDQNKIIAKYVAGKKIV